MTFQQTHMIELIKGESESLYVKGHLLLFKKVECLNWSGHCPVFRIFISRYFRLEIFANPIVNPVLEVLPSPPGFKGDDPKLPILANPKSFLHIVHLFFPVVFSCKRQKRTSILSRKSQKEIGLNFHFPFLSQIFSASSNTLTKGFDLELSLISM